MKLTIIGTGYVGLITGACFAEFGYKTVCVDKDTDRIKAGSISLQQKCVPCVYRNPAPVLADLGRIWVVGCGGAWFYPVGVACLWHENWG